MDEKKNKLQLNTEIIDWDTATGTSKQEKKSGKEPVNKMRRLKKRLIAWGLVFCLLISSYLTIVYSNIPFIAKWRTIYIETAMTTNSHQWLATWFFPKSVIDEVMAKWKKGKKKQKKIVSDWADEDFDDSESKDFFEKYWELDTEAFRSYIEKHPELVKNGYDSILIEDLEGEKGLQTKVGDALLVLDCANNLMIMEVKGEGYKGKLAIVKNPKQVDMVKSKALGSYGQEAESFGQDYDALVVINSSGFKDVDGVGTGGEVKGSLLIDGKEYGYPSTEPTWKFCGMNDKNQMYISGYPYDNTESYRWGMQFFPALIVNGESVVDGTFGMGIQPRAAIAQSKTGDVLLLVVDGRQVGHSLGCTVEDCKNIFVRYKGYQAMNLDGGSSAVMWYNGNYITSSSSVTGKGRYMPDAFIVKKESKDKEIIVPATPKK